MYKNCLSKTDTRYDKHKISLWQRSNSCSSLVIRNVGVYFLERSRTFSIHEYSIVFDEILKLLSKNLGHLTLRHNTT